MLEKLLLLTSILLSTIGLKTPSLDIDKNILQSKANSGIQAEASLNLPLPQISTRPRIDSLAPKPLIASESHILVDMESGTILSSSNENEKLPIASTTKIMTSILVLENYKLSDIVTISDEAASDTEGADHQTVPEEKISVENLLHVLLINSSNRAAYALAEHYNLPNNVGVSRFVELMNTKAQTLGLENTKYMDPAGLNDSGYSSAYDLYLITKYAMKYPVFAKIVGTSEENVTDETGKINYELKNSNRLVREWNYPGTIGVKTGFTNAASHCLVTAVKRNDHTLISVVLHTDLTGVTAVAASALESKKLFDWAFRYTRWGDESSSQTNIDNTNTDSGLIVPSSIE